MPPFLRQRFTSGGIALLYAGFAALWIIASDGLLNLITNDSALLAWLSIIKSAAFVIVTTGLLYLLLRGWRQSIIEKNTSDVVVSKPRQRYWVLTFIGLTLLMPLLDFGIIRLHGPQLEREAYANLQAIADLKANQITHWLAERQGDSKALATSFGFAQYVDQFLRQNDTTLRERILDRLEGLRDAEDYENIMLLDATDRTVINLDDHTEEFVHLQPLLTQARASKQVQRSDLYRDKSGNIHLDWVVPIVLTEPEDRHQVATVVLNIDPQEFLFPLIQHWPTASLSAESLLVRREGESVLFLNELRHRLGAALTQREPLSNPDLPATVAVRTGRAGTMQGIDYRGIPVLAAFRPVVDTDWYLVAKIDRAEVMAPLHRLVFWVSVVALFTIAAITVAVLGLWRQQQRAHRLELLTQAAQQDRLLRKFFDLPFVGMALTSPENKHWLQFNDRLCEILGYPREELVNLTWAEITHPDDLAANLAEFESALRGESDGYVMDKRFIRKDGAVVFATIDAKCVRRNDGTVEIFVSTVNDITEQKRAENQIRALNRLYRVLSNINQLIVRRQQPEWMLGEACQIAVRDGGFLMAWIGLIHPETRQVRPVAQAGHVGNYLENAHITLAGPYSEGPTGTALRTGQAVICNGIAHDPSIALWREAALALGYRASIALPLTVHGVVHGTLNLYAGEVEFFDAEELALLEELAGDIAFALEVAEADATRLQTEERLRQMATVFENTREGIIITDASEHILQVNRAFCELTGYTEAEAQGQTPRLLHSDRHDPAFYAALWASLRETGYWQGEIWNRGKSGEACPMLESISVVKNTAGAVTHYVSVFTDLSKIKASEEKLDFLAHYDALTGLPNRLLFSARLQHSIDIAHRDGKILALLILDLDRFKAVNDSYGHAVGDSVLQQAAERLNSRLRSADTLSRLGGDEFAVLLEDLAQPQDAARVATDIIGLLSEPWSLANGAEVRLGASLGISLFPEHGQTAVDLLQQADAALYQAKSEGRGQFQYFSSALTQIARQRIELEARLRRAIAEQQLRVYYQPQVDIPSGRIVGAEALVRWQDPEHGLIPPGRFIPLAEETGLIGAIGAWVLRETCRQGKEWLDSGLPPLTLAVNLSAHQLRHGDITATVTQALSETGFPAEWLELELTESALMQHEKEAVALLQGLRNLGLRLAMDDFGTGYSSLAHLRRFPLDVLKIDKSFVDDLPQQRDAMEIAATIIAIGHTLGLKVLAEGVETQEQLAFLQAQGCDQYQGYLTSPPVPAEAFIALLTDNYIKTGCTAQLF